MNRHEIIQLVARETRNIVQTGPFRGMRLSSVGSWGDGDISAKLLGVYEQELHSIIDGFASQSYHEITDIGAAEGYYAVGCALLFKDVVVRTFDTSEASHSVLHENARLNGVANRVVISGYCSGPQLRDIAVGKRLLVIVDCEGAEIDLLEDEGVLAALKHSDLIIECHDFLDPAATGKLVGRFSPTHLTTIVYSGGRNPNAFGFLANLPDVDRWLAICEHRPALMNWVICSSKSPHGFTSAVVAS